MIKFGSLSKFSSYLESRMSGSMFERLSFVNSPSMSGMVRVYFNNNVISGQFIKSITDISDNVIGVNIDNSGHLYILFSL